MDDAEEEEKREAGVDLRELIPSLIKTSPVMGTSITSFVIMLFDE